MNIIIYLNFGKTKATSTVQQYQLGLIKTARVSNLTFENRVSLDLTFYLSKI